MSDFHVDLTLKLHQRNNNFQILNFIFSLKQIAKGDTYLGKKWKQEPVLHQAAILEVTSIRHRNDIEKALGELIDISSILKVKSTSSYARRIDIILSTQIRLS